MQKSATEDHFGSAYIRFEILVSRQG